MKALTIHQPWAYCIATGHKLVENRGWTTKYRGPLAIHASATVDRASVDMVKGMLVELGVVPDMHTLVDDRHLLATGAVVAVADLVGICTDSARCRCGVWAGIGHNHWQLRNVRPLAVPVPARGRQQQIEPMPSWPYEETKARRNNTFGATWESTLDLLGREVGHLDVDGPVAVRVVGSPSDVRRDGMLRATARLDHPGVALSFTSKRRGPLTFHCDTFIAIGGRLTAWQANVRAIALGLEALRKVDRYGIAGRGEQYAGWRAIEAGPASAPTFGSPADARRWLRSLAGADGDVADLRLLRLAAIAAHPDRGAGREVWDQFEKARDVLLGDAR